jgi:hypothetical protein
VPFLSPYRLKLRKEIRGIGKVDSKIESGGKVDSIIKSGVEGDSKIKSGNKSLIRAI